jgi:hypothetical protein
MGQHRLVFVPFMFWLNEPLLMVNAALVPCGLAKWIPQLIDRKGTFVDGGCRSPFLQPKSPRQIKHLGANDVSFHQTPRSAGDRRSSGLLGNAGNSGSGPAGRRGGGRHR